MHSELLRRPSQSSNICQLAEELRTERVSAKAVGTETRGSTWSENMSTQEHVAADPRTNPQTRAPSFCHTLTVVIDTPPAVGSWVLTQAPVLLTRGVASPLQNRNAFQKNSAEFCVGDPSPDAIGAGLEEADDSVLASTHVSSAATSF